MATAIKSFMTVKQAAEKYPAFTVGSIRWAIFNQGNNGFAPVVRKLGKKIVLDESAFVAWIERGAVAG